MEINEAIKRQLDLIESHVAFLRLAESESHDSARTMSEIWSLRSLTDTLADMVVARDNGKEIW